MKIEDIIVKAPVSPSPRILQTTRIRIMIVRNRKKFKMNEQNMHWNKIKVVFNNINGGCTKKVEKLLFIELISLK